MAKNKVEAAGVMVIMSGNGSYTVTVWHKLEGGRMHDVVERGLSWTEATDCAITQLDNCRPGWEVGDGWRQPSLDDDLDRPWG